MKAIKIDNQHGIGLILGRTTTTIIDCHGMRKGDDEIILYVSDVSDYDTDFIQSDCAMLHFSHAFPVPLSRPDFPRPRKRYHTWQNSRKNKRRTN